MVKRLITREELTELYVTQGLSQKQIGRRLGVGTRTVGKWLKKDGIEARPKGAPLGCNAGARKSPISREDLEALYITKGLTQRAIAALYGLSEWAVGKRLRAFGIEARPTNYVKDTPRFAKVTADVLRQLYVVERKSQKEIAERFGMNPITVSKWLRRYGIPVESPWERRAIAIDPEEVQRLHQQEGWSLKEIALHFNCSPWVIKSRCQSHGIEIAGLEQRRISNSRRLVNGRPLGEHRGYRLTRGELGVSVLEHRKVAEDAIGRLLVAGEIVHHMNGEKGDNRIENLAILPDNVIHREVHNYMGRIGMYLCGIPGAVCPEPLDFGQPVFWGGSYITVLDLLKNLRRASPENEAQLLDHGPMAVKEVVQ